MGQPMYVLSAMLSALADDNQAQVATRAPTERADGSSTRTYTLSPEAREAGRRRREILRENRLELLNKNEDTTP